MIFVKIHQFIEVGGGAMFLEALLPFCIHGMVCGHVENLFLFRIKLNKRQIFIRC